MVCIFFFQAEDGIRDAQESRGLGDVYKRQVAGRAIPASSSASRSRSGKCMAGARSSGQSAGRVCLLYTSDAADDLLCVALGGRRIIKKNKTPHSHTP